MKELFTSIKNDSFEALNLLQNSDIGSYEHFQVDMGKLSVLQLDSYLEMENYWKQKEKEEEELVVKEKIEPSPTKSKHKGKKHKRKRFEFDYSGLSEEEIAEKKKIFRECQHIHNKALFD